MNHEAGLQLQATARSIQAQLIWNAQRRAKHLYVVRDYGAILAELLLKDMCQRSHQELYIHLRPESSIKTPGATFQSEAGYGR